MKTDEQGTRRSNVPDEHPIQNPKSKIQNRLIGQCAYLIDEVAALERAITLVPEAVLTARPLGRWSVKQLFGLVHDMDEQVFLPRLEAILESDDPVFEEADPEQLVESGAWDDEPVELILASQGRMRRRLADRLAAVPPDAWARSGRRSDGERRTIYDLALDVARHDRERLSAVAYRLHEARLSARG